MKRVATAAILGVFLGTSGCAHMHRPKAPAPQPMRTNAEGVTLIKEHEDFRAEAYRDHNGGWLIGYGHALKKKPQGAITKARAEELLRQDLALCEAAIREEVAVPVTSNAFSAMASLCYTVGVPTFRQSSVVSQLNRGDRQGAADAFLLFTKVKTADGDVKSLSGLLDRRRKERALFLKSDASVPTS